MASTRLRAGLGRLMRRFGVQIAVVALCLSGASLVTSASAQATWSETTGGAANTWTNYTNAGGTQGPTIPAFSTVQIACALQGFRVADGNTWWYQIASPPWNYTFYVSADAFYNNGATSGSLRGTPFVDPAVPLCGGGNGVNETTGGAANTWTNYTNAGGTQGPTIPAFATVKIACKVTGFRVADGNTWWYLVATSPWNSAFYVSADAFFNNGATSGSLRGTPFVDPAVPDCGATPPSTPTGPGETVGGPTNTWTDYTNAGGTQGPTISAFSTVQIACKVTGFRVADGNTWWYRIASSPWNSSYYASADAFYNNGATSGSLLGTPWVDAAVPTCATGARPAGQTAGGVTHTWANYTHAGGTQGPDIPAFTTVQVSCRATGFRVANGNTWWYLVSSAPWSDVFYASADAFYNNGATSGSLVGTPFVDTSVPLCVNNREQPLFSTSVGRGAANATSSACSVADPVDCASGNFWEVMTDISIDGRGPALHVERTYNAIKAGTRGLFGQGWSSTIDRHLDVGGRDGSVRGVLEDGSELVAQPDGVGGLVLPAWSDATIVRNADQTYTLTRKGVQILQFSSAGRLMAERDPNGYQTTYSYDNAGNLASIADANGRVLTVAMSGGLVTSVTDPAGRITRYIYNGAGDLLSVADPLGSSDTFGYDANHLMTSHTDERGGVVTNQFDTAGRVVAQTDAAGLVTRFTYVGDSFSSAGGLTTVTDPHGNVELKQYVNGFLVSITRGAGSPAAAKTTFVQDPVTLGVLATTDPLGRTTNRTFDTKGHLLSVRDPVGNTTSWTYNERGQVLTERMPSGATTTNAYDASGNLLSTTDALGHQTVYSYTDLAHPGDRTATTDPTGRVLRFTYDIDGNLASTAVTPSPDRTDVRRTTFDRVGQPTCEVSAVAVAAGIVCAPSGAPRNAGTATVLYDAGGRPVSTTDSLGRTSSTVYDPAGHPIQRTDADGNVVTDSFDPIGRLLTHTAGAGTSAAATTTSTYDIPAGTAPCTGVVGATYCTTLTDPGGQVTVSFFDARGLEIAVVRPGGLVTRATYDLVGNRASVTDPAGRTVTYSYDAADRLVAIAYSDGATPNVTFGYDVDGRRTQMVDGTGTINTAYDAAGRMISRVDGHGAVVGYEYDAADLLTAITYPGNRTVVRSYDLAGRLIAVTDWTTRSSIFSYDPDGNLVATTYPNGVTVDDTYDANDTLASTTARSGTDTLASLTYARNPVGLVSSEAAAGALGGTTGYVYDASNRLVSAGSVAYGYDAAGNVTGNGATQQTFDVAGRLLTAVSGGNPVTYGYNGVGDRVSMTPASGPSTQYGYDQAGRLIDVAMSFVVPTVVSVSPATGLPSGGSTVTITGSGFVGASTVTFGDVPATAFTVLADDRITAVSPVHVKGAVDITVETPGGISAVAASDQFVYRAPPTISSVTPSSASAAGGTAVTVTGTNLEDVRLVTFAGSPGVVTTQTPTALTVTAPAHAPGDVDLTVTTAEGLSASTPFTYVAVPSVSGLSPAVGTATGGTGIIVSGTALTGATAVTFGGVPATSFSVLSDSQIAVITPPHAAGVIDVVITTSAGASPVAPVAQFTYIVAPTVTSVSPASGPVAGGTTVTITGTSLDLATSVRFGASSATFTPLSPTALSAIAPPGVLGAVDVTVTTPGGTSTAVSASRYTYVAPPTVTSLTPASGPAAGGTTVTITGTGLTGATAVSFGRTPAIGLTVLSATSMRAIAPPGVGGTVDVTVTTPTGTSPVVAADRYTYIAVPVVASLAPNVGSRTGGTVVSITGSGFLRASAVRFGTASASFTVVSDTTITATAPSRSSAGVVDVRVTTPLGQSTVTASDVFTYVNGPTVTSVSPASGAPTGGLTVTVTGSGFTNQSRVSFGGTAGRNVRVNSSTRITVTSPPHTAGTVDVIVSTNAGASPATAGDRFTYVAPLTAPGSIRFATGTPVSLRMSAATAAPPVTQVPIAHYTYDGDGLRSTAATAVGTSTFVWDVRGAVPHVLTDGTSTFIYGPGDLPIAQVDGAGNVSYFFTDSLGSTRALLAGDGTVSATYTYSAYGAITGHTGSAETPLTYGGGYQDVGTGLLYLVHRYYDPTTAQFMTVDPAIGMSQSAYRYAASDPVNRSDPGGEFPHIALGAAIGAIAGTVAAMVTSSSSIGSRAWWGDVAGGAVGGAVTGACLAASWNAAACGAAGGAAGQLAGDLVGGRGFRPLDVAVAAGVGGLIGLIPAVTPTVGRSPYLLSNLLGGGPNTQRLAISALVGSISGGATTRFLGGGSAYAPGSNSGAGAPSASSASWGPGGC